MQISNIKILNVITIFVTISILLPLAGDNLPYIIRSHHLWAMIWLYSLILFNLKLLENRIIIYCLLYGLLFFILLNTLWYDVDKVMKVHILREFYDILLALSIIMYYRIKKDYKGLAILVKLSLYFIIITAVMSIITSFMNPTYTRDITHVGTLDPFIAKYTLSYKKYGGANYSYASAFVTIIPIFFYYIVNNKMSFLNKRILIICVGVIYITLIRIQLFANILISSIIIILCLLGSNNVKKGKYLIIIAIIIVLLIPLDHFIDMLHYLGDFFDSDSILYEKFNDLAKFLRAGGYDETGTGARAARYPLLLDSFISNPLSGGRDWDFHLYWMNKLAVFGLLGVIPFLILNAIYFQYNIQDFNRDFKFYYFLSISSVVVLGLMKAVVGIELWFVVFVVLPGSYYLQIFSKSNSNDNKIKINDDHNSLEETVNKMTSP